MVLYGLETLCGTLPKGTCKEALSLSGSIPGKAETKIFLVRSKGGIGASILLTDVAFGMLETKYLVENIRMFVSDLADFINNRFLTESVFG